MKWVYNSNNYSLEDINLSRITLQLAYNLTMLVLQLGLVLMILIIFNAISLMNPIQAL